MRHRHRHRQRQRHTGRSDPRPRAADGGGAPTPALLVERPAPGDLAANWLWVQKVTAFGRPTRRALVGGDRGAVLGNAEADHCLVVRLETRATSRRGTSPLTTCWATSPPGGAAEAVVEPAAGGPTVEGWTAAAGTTTPIRCSRPRCWNRPGRRRAAGCTSSTRRSPAAGRRVWFRPRQSRVPGRSARTAYPPASSSPTRTTGVEAHRQRSSAQEPVLGRTAESGVSHAVCS